MDKNKEKFWWKTSFIVFTYAIILAVCVAIQAGIKMCIKFDFTVKSYVLADFINGKLEMPISNMAWLWTAICAAYVGVDRAAYAIKTSKLERGFADVGDPQCLRRIIVVSGLLFIEASVLNGFVDANFDLNAFSSAFGSSVLLYVAGQKAIKTVKYVDGSVHNDSHSTNEQDSCRDIDSEKPGKGAEDFDIVSAINHKKSEDDIAMDRVSKAFFESPESKESVDIAMNIIKQSTKKVTKKEEK